jgi:predicted P-loop ATPase
MPKDNGQPRSLRELGEEAWAKAAAAEAAKSKTGKGRSMLQVLQVLQSSPNWRGVLAFNEFSLRIIAKQEIPGDAPPRGVPRDLQDVDITAALAWFHGRGMTALGRESLCHAIALHARRHGRFHPVLEFFAEVTAGEDPNEVHSRSNDQHIDPELPTPDALSGLLTFGFGAEDMLLNRALSRAFMISMVRRVRRPGSQNDHMLVLVGDQGIGKSTGLRTLIGDQWFADSMPDLHSKDAKLQLHGKVAIEWSELSALHKSRIETVKNFITSPIDTFRMPYDRAASDVPRSCSFVGTTNIGEFLTDATGGRRFWPVRCRYVDRAWIANNRRLIWRLGCEAEAVGEPNWPAAPELQAELRHRQAEAQERDAWEERVMRSALDGMTIDEEFLSTVLQISIQDQNKGHVMRVADILRRNGWEKDRRQRKGDRIVRWHPKPVE